MPRRNEARQPARRARRVYSRRSWPVNDARRLLCALVALPCCSVIAAGARSDDARTCRDSPLAYVRRIVIAPVTSPALQRASEPPLASSPRSAAASKKSRASATTARTVALTPEALADFHRTLEQELARMPGLTVVPAGQEGAPTLADGRPDLPTAEAAAIYARAAGADAVALAAIDRSGVRTALDRTPASLVAYRSAHRSNTTRAVPM